SRKVEGHKVAVTEEARNLFPGDRANMRIKWGSLGVRGRMEQRGVHAELRGTGRAEKQAREQADAGCGVLGGNLARETPTALIESPKPAEIPVGRNVLVAAEDATATLPEIGDDHNIGLVISGAGFQPCLPFTHFVGPPQV